MNTILKPNISSVMITPNPVSTNTSFLIAISVSEMEISIEPSIKYCGTFKCGENGEI